MNKIKVNQLLSGLRFAAAAMVLIAAGGSARAQTAPARRPRTMAS